MHLRLGSNRRAFLKASLLLSAQGLAESLWSSGRNSFGLRYAIASSLYGNLPLSVILPEVKKAGSQYIDLWPRIWGTQREEVSAMGNEKFGELLQQNGVKLAISTRFDLGPFKLADEIQFLRRFGGRTIVTGSIFGMHHLQRAALKGEIKKFVEQMRPHLSSAGEAGIKIAIENHANSLIASPDAIRWLAEAAGELPLGIALAPYHLQQDSAMLARLIQDLGPKLVLFYAWQYGMGCMKPMPPKEELMQLPGRGKLDFTPLLQALKNIRFTGWTEIFMHHTPRGVPIWPTAPQITEDIVQARQYLQGILKGLRT
jgi:sugar phosphate isomerase/epimerase